MMARCSSLVVLIILLSLLLLLNVDPVFSFTSNYVMVKLFSGETKVQKGESKIHYFPDVTTLFNVNGSDVSEIAIENTDLQLIDVAALQKLTKIKSITITGNKLLRKIHKDTFVANRDVHQLNLANNFIDYISPNAFHGVFVKKRLSGRLQLSKNNLRQFPVFSEKKHGLATLSLDGNPLQHADSDSLKNLTDLVTLSMQSTELTSLPDNFFKHSSSLDSLDMSDNRNLRRISRDAFNGLENLRKLDISQTGIIQLPSNGLDNLEILHMKETPALWEISDGIVGLARLKEVLVAADQTHLCCAFEMRRAVVSLRSVTSDKTGGNVKCPSPAPAQKPVTKKQVIARADSKGTSSRPVITVDPFMNGFFVPRTTKIPDGFFGKRRKKRDSQEFGGFDDGFVVHTTVKNNLTDKKRNSKDSDFDPFGGNTYEPINHSQGVVICDNNHTEELASHKRVDVICKPAPDALRPCDDIMGNDFLTGLSWVVAFIALLGNSVVFTVLVLSRRTMTVTKFLLANLSFADLLLALYLFVLVCASGYTSGDYYNFVREWQYGGGCSMAGVLAIFSSQLSMLVLIIITIERYFAIVHAMYLHRRLSMKQAKIGIACSWLYSLLLAALPLLGLNSYNEVAICLPFRTAESGDMAYLSFLLISNFGLFIAVVLAYIRMYAVVRSPHLASGAPRADSDVAKRMALLVFTDFACWGPIALVGLISAFGSGDMLNMDVKKSKYLLVIFFPINALCNPFLYALSTNTFRRDLFDLLLRCGICQTRIAQINQSVYSNCSMKAGAGQLNNEPVTLNSQVSRISFKKMFSRQSFKEPTTLTTPISGSPALKRNGKEVGEILKMAAVKNKEETPLIPVTTQISEPDDRMEESDFFSEDTHLMHCASFHSRNGDIEESQEETKPKSDSVTSGFSQYDLSHEAFKSSKETPVTM